MSSREYGLLKKNVSDLKKQFLNFEKRIDGRYTRYELTQCRAFIAFCHTEIEIYLEALSTKVVQGAERHWARHKKPTNAIVAMLAYRSKSNALPDSPTDQAQKTKLDSLIGSAISMQKSAIKANHGIKPKNLSELFIPIGMKPEKFDGALLIQLGNLGERRGDQVHQSSQVSLPKIRDPFDDERKDIDFLVNELNGFDLVVAKLR